MTDSILTDFENEVEKKILYQPRSGEEMEKATLHRVPIYKYSDLCALSKKKGGPERMLAHMFKRSNDNIILLQDPHDMNSGHWISVSRNIPRKEIYFFSTYGGRPDVEKNKWMNDDELYESGQELNIFNDGLRSLQKRGWKIHYNDFPYQKPRDKTATCGIYTAAFLRFGADPDKFKEMTKTLMNYGINPALYYYNEFFV